MPLSEHREFGVGRPGRTYVVARTGGSRHHHGAPRAPTDAWLPPYDGVSGGVLVRRRQEATVGRGWQIVAVDPYVRHMTASALPGRQAPGASAEGTDQHGRQTGHVHGGG